MEKLNIGAGTLPKPGFKNLDRLNYPGIDVVHDLTVRPYPFPDNTFDVIEGDHILEHVPELNLLMGELYRIAKPNAILKFIVPHHASGNWPIDPTHCNKFFINTCLIFDEGNEKTKMHPWQHAGLYHYKIRDWKLTFAGILKPFEWFVKRFPGFYDYYLCYMIRPVDLIFTLKAIK